MMTDVDPLLSPAAVATTLPFNTGRLDQLLEAAGIDVLLVTSKHNIRYLLSGYSFFFFDQFDAIGITRYLPILIYPKGRPHQAVYIGNLMEDSEAENGRFWCPTVETRASGTLDAVDLAIKHIRRLDMAGGTIGLEASFFPGDALDALRSGLPGTRTTDGHFSLERLRAVKTADELLLIREASERVVEAMMVTFASCRPGMTKRDLMNRLRQEEIERGLNVDYCLMTAGSGLNRAPSDQVIQNGAGKSTLIKILAGVYAADGDEILFRGQPVRRVADLPIVFIHQDLGLVDWMTITDTSRSRAVLIGASD